MPDYFRPANGLLYSTVEAIDGVAIEADNEPEDGWASDGEVTLFEEDHEVRGGDPGDTRSTASEMNDLQGPTVL